MTFCMLKRLLDRTSYFPWRDSHLPPEGWAQDQRQKIMFRRPQVWILGLSRHSWGCYDDTKEIWGHSPPCSPKDLQTIVSVHWYDQLLLWHVAKGLWASCPSNFFNLQKRQVRLERRSPKLFDAIKRVIGCELLLTYPDFNALFKIHNNASKLQIVAVIPWKGNSIDFY